MAALPHRLRVLAVLSFVAVAIVQTWPLALHFSTDVTGNPGGDTGAYLWNIWHFRHRLVDLGKSPFWTDGIFALTGATNLALHNYTVFADLIALPLQSFAGVVTAFNAAYVTNVALAGLGMFLRPCEQESREPRLGRPSRDARHVALQPRRGRAAAVLPVRLGSRVEQRTMARCDGGGRIGRVGVLLRSVLRRLRGPAAGRARRVAHRDMPPG